MLLLLLAAEFVTMQPVPPTPRLETKARVMIMIVEGQPVSAERWRETSGQKRREIRRLEPDGSMSHIRLVEFE
jgi:hypothetical protein